MLSNPSVTHQIASFIFQEFHARTSAIGRRSQTVQCLLNITAIIQDLMYYIASSTSLQIEILNLITTHSSMLLPLQNVALEVATEEKLRKQRVS